MSLRDDIRESLTRGLPRALILRDDYKINGKAVPRDTPLSVSAWGRTKAGITYNVLGWDLLAETDEFLIVSLGDKAWAIPRALRHDKLVSIDDSDINSLTEIMEDFLNQVGAHADEEDVWGEEPEDGW
jgi:hypothetical protein